jgi:hypothetical protein
MTMPLDPTQAPGSKVLDQMIAKHGPLLGSPALAGPGMIQDPSSPGDKTAQIPDPDPAYIFFFSDGSTLTMNWGGQIKALDEKAPSGQAPRATQTYTDPSGTLWEKDPSTGVWAQARGVPPGSKQQPGATKATPPAQWVPIKAPDGRVIAMADPADPTHRVSVPETGSGRPADGTTKQTIEGGRTITWIARSGEWSIQGIGQPMADPNKPQEGATRQNVAGGYEIREKFVGGQWVTDPTFAPRPYDPKLAGQPKEGDVRDNVVGGQVVKQKYQGGEWTIDPSAAPRPYAPSTPTTLNTGTAPYIIQQTPEQAQQGTVSTIPNPNTTDTAARVTQLQAAATAKRDDLERRYQSGSITLQERDAQFQDYWDNVIEPQRQQLDQAQQTTQAAARRQAEQDQRVSLADEATYERNRQADARQAGRDAVADVNASLPYRVGPNFGANFSKALNTLSSGGGAVSFSPNDFTFDMPDTAAIAEQATARALAHISPYAAMKAGMPMPQIPQGIDLNSALNPGRYQFSGGAPASTGTTVTLPDGTKIESSGPAAPTAASMPAGGAVPRNRAAGGFF